jgi:outer membrane lipoprotein-sorting protein
MSSGNSARGRVYVAYAHEEKSIKLLKQPLRAEGEVFFTKPGWIARKTDKPEPSLLVLRDGQLLVSDPSGKRSFDVSGSPVLRAFVEGFVQVLSGDRAALERSYELHFELQSAGVWRLSLKPKLPALARFLSELSFVGKGNHVEHMSLREQSGDETRTDFSDVQLGGAFAAAERERLFTVPGH